MFDLESQFSTDTRMETGRQEPDGHLLWTRQDPCSRPQMACGRQGQRNMTVIGRETAWPLVVGLFTCAAARAPPVRARAVQAQAPGSRLRGLVSSKPAMLAPASVARPFADSFTTPPRHWGGSTAGVPWTPWAPLLPGARQWESQVPAAGCGGGLVAAPFCIPSRGRGGPGTGFFSTTITGQGVFPARPPRPPRLGISSTPQIAVQVWTLIVYVGCCFLGTGRDP